ELDNGVNAKHLNDKFYFEGDQRVSLRDKIFREAISNLLIHREFSNPFPVTNQDTNQDINQDNNEINKLLEFCKTPRTRGEMQQFMSLNNRGYFRTKILNPLIKGGLLKMTLPDKPTSRNQQYYSDR
ncbi:Fic family protein, partial [Halolactibacillus miurensis]